MFAVGKQPYRKIQMKIYRHKLVNVLTFIVCVVLLASDRAASQTFSNLYAFPAAQSPSFINGEGANPLCLIFSGSIFYGSAQEGGEYGYGTVFRVNIDGTGFTNLYSFNGLSNGEEPAGLILSGSTLFGVSTGNYKYPSYGNGKVFSLSTDGTVFTPIYSFTNGTDGANPSSGLVLHGNALFGTAGDGAKYGFGTIFMVYTNGTGFTNLHNFSVTSVLSQTNSDGSNPYAGLVLSGNTLFGTTAFGGPNGAGTVFAINTDGTGFTNLHNFSSRTLNNNGVWVNQDGLYAQQTMLLSGYTLYGTTDEGGTNGNGTIFRINTDGTGFTTLHTFGLGLGSDINNLTNIDGADPTALILSGNRLLGVAGEGGTNAVGTIFALNTDGSDFAVLYTCSLSNNNGAQPWSGLNIIGDTFYASTFDGGTYGGGTIFDLTTPNFLANQTIGAVPLTVQFTSPNIDGIDHVITNWFWNFGDGFTSTAQNPVHTYTNTGVFYPSLNAINDFGVPVASSGPSISVLHLPVNGGFETGDFSDWTSSGNFSSCSVVTGPLYAYSGDYGAQLGPAFTLGYLSQNLPTAAGEMYLLSFWLDSPDGVTPNEFSVAWNGTTLLDKKNWGAIGWTNMQFIVTATSTNTLLQFGFRDDNSFLGLDNISVGPLMQPKITSIRLSGANLILNGTSGISNFKYVTQMSTNLIQWVPIGTNVLRANGDFTIIATNAINLQLLHQYYRIVAEN